MTNALRSNFLPFGIGTKFRRKRTVCTNAMSKLLRFFQRKHREMLPPTPQVLSSFPPRSQALAAPLPSDGEKQQCRLEVYFLLKD